MNFLRLIAIDRYAQGLGMAIAVVAFAISECACRANEPISSQRQNNSGNPFFQNAWSEAAACDSAAMEPFKDAKERAAWFPFGFRLFESRHATERSANTEKNIEGAFENWGRIYSSKSNRTVQEVWLLGRYHGQQHWADGNSGNSSGWENRRYRMGTQARVVEKATLHAQLVSGSDFEPFYNGFTELWAQWEFSSQIALTVGQQKHRFTHDRNVSSRYISTLERSQLVNMFRADYTPAVTLQGTVEKLSYYSGVFSNATGTDMWQAFTDLNSGYSLLTNVYYDITERTPVDAAHLGMSYVYSDANSNATNLNVFEQGVSGVIILTNGPASLVSEAVTGLDAELGDAYGINAQLGYFFTDRLQWITRIQVAASEDANGLLAQFRYEQPAGLTSGDSYHSEYIGTNYHIAGHRIKWMTGVEHSELSGESLWTFSTAIRIFWGPHSGGPFPMASTLPGRW